jgi:hypothetical protein
MYCIDSYVLYVLYWLICIVLIDMYTVLIDMYCMYCIDSYVLYVLY